MNNEILLKNYVDHINDDAFLSTNTKYAYIGDNRSFIAWLGDRSALEVTPETIEALIASMVAMHRSTSSVHRMVISVRNFYKFAKAEGHVSANPVKDFTAKRVNELMGE